MKLLNRLFRNAAVAILVPLIIVSCESSSMPDSLSQVPASWQVHRPLANPEPDIKSSLPFVGLWVFEPGAIYNDGMASGTLAIEPPCAYLEVPQPDGTPLRHLLLLPENITNWDEATETLVTADFGPVGSGDHVSVGGGEGGSADLGPCSAERAFNATFVCATAPPETFEDYPGESPRPIENIC